MNKQPSIDALERAVDTYGLPWVLETLEGICNAKADHLSSNWQDSVGEKVWHQAAQALAKLNTKSKAIKLMESLYSNLRQ